MSQPRTLSLTFADVERAFGISEDDVATVLERLGQPHDDASAEAWMKSLNLPAAAHAALAADGDMDAQTDAAWDNLEQQISAVLETRKAMDETRDRLHGQPRPSSARRHA